MVPYANVCYNTMWWAANPKLPNHHRSSGSKWQMLHPMGAGQLSWGTSGEGDVHKALVCQKASSSFCQLFCRLEGLCVGPWNSIWRTGSAPSPTPALPFPRPVPTLPLSLPQTMTPSAVMAGAALLSLPQCRQQNLTTSTRSALCHFYNTGSKGLPPALGSTGLGPKFLYIKNNNNP